jgi:uncharacterized membrane protein
MSDESPRQDRLADIAARLDYLEFVAREQLARLYAIEQRVGLSVKPAEAVRDAPLAPPSQPSTKQIEAQERPAARPASRGSLEQRIGGNWLNRIGVLAIIVGVGFFLKYAFESDWIGPRERVAAGLVAGIGLLFAGDRLTARGLRHYGQGLVGGGIGILYLSIYAAFGFYNLIAHPIAFVCMALVTTTAVWLAVRQNALGIAMLGALGGFLTPVILSTNRDNQIGLFTYLLVLDLGVLAVAWFKAWRSLEYLAFMATALVSTAWIQEWYDPAKFGRTLFFLTVIFAIFVMVPVVQNLVRKRATLWMDLSLICANGLFYFITCHGLMEPRPPSRGLFAALLSLAYFGLTMIAWERRGDRMLLGAFFGMAAFFLTLAIPIQFDRQWVTVLLAVEAVSLLYVGLVANERLVRLGAALVFAAAFVHWIAVEAHETNDAIIEGGQFNLLFNQRAFGCAVMTGVLVLASWLLRHYREESPQEEERVAAIVCVLAAHVLALLGLSLEAYSFYQVRIRFMESYDTEQIGLRSNLEFGRQLVLSIIWGVYATFLMVWGIWRSRREQRWLALGLLLLTIAKVFLIDLASLERIYRIASFLALGVILLLVSYLYQRAQRPRQRLDANAER